MASRDGAVRHVTPKHRLSLYWKIFVLVMGVAAVCLVPVVILVETTLSQALLYHVGRQSLATARTVAEMPVVREWVGKPEGAAHIQPLAERIRRRTGFDFIVVMDTHSIRYSHPEPDRIGARFVGGDEGRALLGEEYISQAVGTLGPSQRSFAPILGPTGAVVGAVSVGGLMPGVEGMVAPVRESLSLALLLGVLVAALGAGMLTQHIKGTLLGMEPREIADALYGREAILQSVREGVIAVNQLGRITLVNDVAKDYLERGDEVIGQDITAVLANTRLAEVLHTGLPEYDQQQLIGRTRVVTNRVPMVVQGKVIGAVATFRDQSEVSRLAEELGGVRGYIEAMRVQAHDFSNKLHTISGLLQLGRSSEAIDVIHSAQSGMRNLNAHVSPRIIDQGIAAIIIGKIGRAQELGIELTLTEDSLLESLKPELRQALMVVIGNLVDNALESLLGGARGEAKVALFIRQRDESIVVSVTDNGGGVADHMRERVFEPGFSTKLGRGRGLGLHLVKEAVVSLAGTIQLSSMPHEYTCFTVTVPLRTNQPQVAIPPQRDEEC